MFSIGSSFIGIDPTAGRKPFSYAALDADLRLNALGRGSLEEVLAFAAGQQQAIVAVCAPRRPSQRLMERTELRDSLNPPPHPGRWMNFRLVEYLLRQHGISCYKTPPDEKTCPNWMQMGFHLYKRLEQMGYLPYPSKKPGFAVAGSLPPCQLLHLAGARAHAQEYPRRPPATPAGAA